MVNKINQQADTPRHQGRTAPDLVPHELLNDGASISYLSIGSGPALLVVPGALSTAIDYAAFARALGERFTVHILERRGRGRSSPQGEDYSIAKDCSDLLALQHETGASFWVGHSFGGLVALEAARRNPLLKKLAVYEPGVSIGGSISMAWMPRYEKLLADQKHFDALVEFSRGTGPDRGRAIPRWLMKFLLPFFVNAEDRRRMLGLLPENLREHRELARLDNQYEAYREISADVLIMYGQRSQIAWVPLAVERLAAVIPHADRRELAKLDHFGITHGSPGAVAAAVADFVLA